MTIALDHATVNAQLEAQWRAPDIAARDATHWQRRMAILVPYRDRAEHLQTFLEHMQNYFRHDKLDRQIRCTIHVIEQADVLAFNRGALLNAGFRLAAEHNDYVCLHDVDMLPIWADYAWPGCPSRVCLYGLAYPQHKHWCIGGAAALSVADFQALNGFSNGYRGWGYEDYDFRLRMLALGLSLEARDGLFSALPHARNGVKPDGGESDAGRRNRERMESLHARGFDEWPHEGLNSLRFRHIDSVSVAQPGAPADWIRHHRVAFAD